MFNLERIIDGGRGNASILAQVALLGQARQAVEWFERRVLAPSAHAWLRAWCGVVGEQARRGMARVAAQKEETGQLE